MAFTRLLVSTKYRWRSPTDASESRFFTFFAFFAFSGPRHMSVHSRLDVLRGLALLYTTQRTSTQHGTFVDDGCPLHDRSKITKNHEMRGCLCDGGPNFFSSVGVSAADSYTPDTYSCLPMPKRLMKPD
jgi:hypothetical protein